MLQTVGESLSLTVPNLDIKKGAKAGKDAAVSKTQNKAKQPFIPEKRIPSNFINRTQVGDASYDVYSGLASSKNMKAVQNNFLFKFIP